MRYLKLGLLALIVALAAIGLLRITDVITAAQAPWLAKRAFAAIVLLMVVGLALGAVTSRGAPDESADRPIP
jgi:multisubunit Na+/H+ antiporter MnhG subunit